MEEGGIYLKDDGGSGSIQVEARELIIPNRLELSRLLRIGREKGGLSIGDLKGW